MRPLHSAAHRKTITQAPTHARCDFCGRTNRIPDTWLPSPCPHCDRLYFPLASRARRVAALLGLVVLAILTVFFWELIF